MTRVPFPAGCARLVALSLLAAWSVRPSSAIQIRNDSAATNNRFASGFWTAAPAPNASGSFLGATADLSPLGWEDTPRDGGRPKHATLVAPLFAVAAAHYAFPSGRTLLFRSRDGDIVPRVTEASNTAFDDVSIVRLARPLARGDDVSNIRILDVASAGRIVGMPTRPVGGHATAGTKLAVSAVSGLLYGDVFTQHSTSSYSFSKNDPGDSGSPVFLPYKGEFTLLGPVSTAGGAGHMLVPNADNTHSTAAQVNALMAPHGYALRFAIYDMPGEPTRTSPTWSATATDADWGQGANWSPRAEPVGLPVVLPRETAANGARVSAPAEVRGILFRGAGTAPQRITGAGVLSIGTSGLRNDSPGAAPTLSCPVRLTGSQNWEAVAGGLIVSGAVDTNGFLAAVHCGHDVSLAGPVSGSGLVAKSGPGVLLLTGANTYSGYTYIHEGVVRLGADAAASSASVVTFAGEADAELDVDGRSASVGGLRSKYGANGVVRLGGGTLFTGLVTSALTYDGTFVGPGAVIKQGGGNWTLRGDNAGYGGVLEIREGTLTLGAPRALGGALNLVTDAARIETTSSVELEGEVTFAGTHNGSGGYTAGRGAQFFSSWGSGTRTVFRDRLTLERRGAGTGQLRMSLFGNGGGGQHIVLAGGVRTTGATTGPMRLSLSTASDTNGLIEVIAPIRDDEGAALELNVTGSGVLRLRSPSGSAYRGGTVVNAGATLVLEPSEGSATGSGLVRVLSGGVLAGSGRIGGTFSLEAGAELRLALPEQGGPVLRAASLALAADARLTITEIAPAVRAGRHVLVEGAGAATGAAPALVLPEGFTGFAALEGGDLVLRLTGEPYAHWAEGHALEGDAAEWTADPDGDGAPNGLEFALGTSPVDSGSVATARAELAGGRAAIAFTRATDTASLRVEASGDLKTWETIPHTPVEPGVEQVVVDVVDVASSAGGRRFMRLVAEDGE